jgi:hypothetical protein
MYSHADGSFGRLERNSGNYLITAASGPVPSKSLVLTDSKAIGTDAAILGLSEICLTNNRTGISGDQVRARGSRSARGFATLSYIRAGPDSLLMLST